MKNSSNPYSFLYINIYNTCGYKSKFLSVEHCLCFPMHHLLLSVVVQNTATVQILRRPSLRMLGLLQCLAVTSPNQT